MSKIQLSRSVVFALEMVRACLPLIPGRELELSSMFMQMNFEMEGHDASERRVVLSILIYPDVHVSANAIVQGLEGSIQIQLPPNNLIRHGEPTWSFECRGDPKTKRLVAQLVGQRP